MKKILTISITFIMTLLPPLASAEDEVLAIPVQRLTLETALTIAQGAVEACRKQGIQIGVSVVTRDGLEQVMLRDTIAAPITSKIALGKAFAAVNFNVATSALNDRANTPIGRVEGVVMAAGGLPISAGGALIGGIGVSGAPSGVTDEECAQAGIDLVQDDLDFM
jgi:uncharacterized protein GlcG (DUF336 family)